MTLISQTAQKLDDLFGHHRPEKLAIAVSGGGDSLALLYLAAAWAKTHRTDLVALTVDHGLRSESAAEAAFVAKEAATLSLPHHTLTWSGWDNRGNLQDMARQARRTLIEDWCISHNIDTALTGHTADDQAETVLMRLARGSGVDGLAGIAASEHHGIRWVRPLLDQKRKDLRDYLRDQGIKWIDDPSNDDPRFDRIRARQMMTQLGDLGLTPDRLIQTSNHMQAAQTSLRKASLAFANAHVIEDRGDLILSPKTLDLSRGDTERRVFAAAIRWVSTAPNRPRFHALQNAAHLLLNGQRTTLHGVLMTPAAGKVRLSREPSAIVKTKTPMKKNSGKIMWDQRWCIENRVQSGQFNDIVVRALGEDGLAVCKDWRETGLPRASLLSSPSIWSNQQLIGAPLAGIDKGWRCYIVTNFTDSLLSH